MLLPLNFYYSIFVFRILISDETFEIFSNSGHIPQNFDLNNCESGITLEGIKTAVTVCNSLINLKEFFHFFQF